jgi:hypothetical protein
MPRTDQLQLPGHDCTVQRCCTRAVDHPSGRHQHMHTRAQERPSLSQPSCIPISTCRTPRLLCLHSTDTGTHPTEAPAATRSPSQPHKLQVLPGWPNPTSAHSQGFPGRLLHTHQHSPACRGRRRSAHGGQAHSMLYMQRAGSSGCSRLRPATAGCAHSCAWCSAVYTHTT